MNKEIENKENIDINKLLDKLKSEDLRNKKLMRMMYILYISLSTIYIALFLTYPNPDILAPQRLGFLLMFLAFILFSLLFRNRYKNLKEIDYSLPVVDLLRKASYKQRFWSLDLLLALLISLLVDIPITMFFYGIFSNTDNNPILIIATVQLIYFIIIGVTLYFSHKTWKIKQKPLWSSINEMIKELDNE